MPRNRLLRAAPLAALLLAVLVPVAFAATVEQGTTYTLAQGQVVNDDLYVFAQTVTIAGHVYGDVIAAGTKVEVAPSGVVDGDLMAAGQDVLVEGSVGDDVRAAAYTVEVRDGAHVGGDLLGAGFNVSIAQGATVTRDVVAAGSQGIVDGMVGRNLKFAGSGLEVTGSVDGDVEAVVSGGAEGEAPPMALFPMLPPPPRTVAPGLIIAATARIGGDLRYPSSDRGGRHCLPGVATPSHAPD
jgi:cytoskeletal protein CcmA (bactofilin family)